MQITCTTPNLFIPTLRVQFVDGVADVDEALLPDLLPYVVHGVELPDDVAVADQDGVTRPRGNASKKVWTDYATGLGIEVPDTAKVAEIRDLVEAHEAAAAEGTPEDPEADGNTTEADAGDISTAGAVQSDW